METQVKELMCKDVGRGAMAKVDDIVEMVQNKIELMNLKEWNLLKIQ